MDGDGAGLSGGYRFFGKLGPGAAAAAVAHAYYHQRSRARVGKPEAERHLAALRLDVAEIVGFRFKSYFGSPLGMCRHREREGYQGQKGREYEENLFHDCLVYG